MLPKYTRLQGARNSSNNVLRAMASPSSSGMLGARNDPGMRAMTKLVQRESKKVQSNILCAMVDPRKSSRPCVTPDQVCCLKPQYQHAAPAPEAHSYGWSRSTLPYDGANALGKSGPKHCANDLSKPCTQDFDCELNTSCVR